MAFVFLPPAELLTYLDMWLPDTEWQTPAMHLFDVTYEELDDLLVDGIPAEDFTAWLFPQGRLSR